MTILIKHKKNNHNHDKYQLPCMRIYHNPILYPYIWQDIFHEISIIIIIICLLNFACT